MTEQEETLRKAISYCIEFYDNKEATNRIMQFIKDDRALQLLQTDVIVSGGFKTKGIMKTAENFYLEKTGWENIESVEELDTPKDVINMIDDFANEKESVYIKFLDWVFNNCKIPSDGYVWKYKKEYYTSKQLFSFWKDLFIH